MTDEESNSIFACLDCQRGALKAFPQSRPGKHRKKYAMKMYLTLVEKELTKGEYVER